MKLTMASLKKDCISELSPDKGFPSPASPARGPGSFWAAMVPVFKITVKARPVTASKLACFKLHLRAHEDTLLAQARLLLGRGAILGMPFRPRQKGLASLLAVAYGLEVATGAAFQRVRTELKKT